MEAAKAIKKHPFDAFESAPDDIRIAVFNILVLGPHGIARHRRAELNRWRQLASLMEPEEKELHRRLQTGPKLVLKKVRLRLLQMILKAIGWEDKDLAKDLVAGMPIVGKIPCSTVFEKKEVPASKSVEDLWKSAKLSRVKLLQSLSPGDADMDLALLRGTVKEYRPGGGQGVRPSVAPGSEVLHSAGLAYRRRQGGSKVQADRRLLRVRPQRGSRHHGEYRHRRHGLDGWFGPGLGEGCCVRAGHHTAQRRKLPDGRASQGWQTEGLVLHGYLEDLKAAYRQVPRRESQRPFFVVAYWDCEVGAPMVGEHIAQPFGATAAVLNFNRVARALKAVFVRKLFFPTSQFYDDFTVIEPASCAREGRELWEAAMEVLGWATECKVDP